MKALLLSAGYGSRFKPQTEQIPKPALSFMGLPMLLYALESTKELGAKDFYVNLHHLPDRLKREVGYFSNSTGPIHYVYEKNILGSGGAIANLKSNLIGEDFIVCNGDEVLLPNSLHQMQDIITKHKKNNYLASLLVTKHPEAGKTFGAIWCDKEQVKHIGKDDYTFKLQPYHYIGLMLLSPRIFSYLPEGESNILYDCILPAIEKGESVGIHDIDCLWHETGNLSDFLKSHDSILQNWDKPETDHIKNCLAHYLPDYLEQIHAKHNHTHFLVSNLKTDNVKYRRWNFIDPKIQEVPNLSMQRSVLQNVPQDKDIEIIDTLFV